MISAATDRQPAQPDPPVEFRHVDFTGDYTDGDIKYKIQGAGNQYVLVVEEGEHGRCVSKGNMLTIWQHEGWLKQVQLENGFLVGYLAYEEDVYLDNYGIMQCIDGRPKAYFRWKKQ